MSRESRREELSAIGVHLSAKMRYSQRDLLEDNGDGHVFV
jgi:hypothetical protein